MKKVIIGSLFALITVNAQAGGFSGSHTPTGIFGAGIIKFGVDNRIAADTCDYYGRHFQFNATGESGKNILSILIAAKMANKKINIWYTASSTPGTSHLNGCNPSTLAIINEIGFTD